MWTGSTLAKNKCRVKTLDRGDSMRGSRSISRPSPGDGIEPAGAALADVARRRVELSAIATAQQGDEVPTNHQARSRARLSSLAVVPYEVKARSATRDAWVTVVHETQPEFVPWLLPDGQNVSVLIADGRTEALGFTPRLRLRNRGTRFGDLLWTGEDIKLASTRLVDALSLFNAGGWSSFEIELVDKKGVPIGGFVVFAVDRSELDVQSDIFPVSAGPYYGFGVIDRLMQFLRGHNIDDFDMVPLPEKGD